MLCIHRDKLALHNYQHIYKLVYIVSNDTIGVNKLGVNITDIHFIQIVFAQNIKKHSTAADKRLGVLGDCSIIKRIILFNLSKKLTFSASPFQKRFNFFTIALRIAGNPGINRLFCRSRYNPHIPNHSSVINSAFRA